MAKDVIMPVLGMNQDTAVLLAWLKQEGERVEQGEPIMEVETDKATMELDSPASGTLARVAAAAGDEVRVGSVIAVILADGEAADASVRAAASDDGSRGTASNAAAAPAAAAPTPQPQPTPQQALQPTPLAAAAAPTAALVAAPGRDGRLEPLAPGRVLASPKARRLASEHGVPLAALSGRGGGPEGAVLAADVMRAAEAAVPGGGRWATFQRELDAGALLAALGSTVRHLGALRGRDGDAPTPELGDLIARFLGAVWRHVPLAPGPASLRYRRVADGDVHEAAVADLASAGLPAVAAARAAAVPTPGWVTLSLLDLSRSRADLTGELPGASDGALLQVVVGRLDAPDGADASARLTLRLAFDVSRVELAAAAAWADRVLALAEEPAALALLY